MRMSNPKRHWKLIFVSRPCDSNIRKSGRRGGLRMSESDHQFGSAQMSEAVIDDVVALLPPLLQSIEALGFVARHFHPPSFDRVMDAAGQPDEDLGAVRSRLLDWPAEFADIRSAIETASDAALSAFSGLRAVRSGQGDMALAFRARRQLPRAEEAVYPLAAKFPPVSSFFLNPELCEDPELLARLAAPANDATGIIHDHNEPRSRGGFSLYVPEYYTP